MAKTTLKELSKQLRDPGHIDGLRELLRRRFGLRLRVANLRVENGYLFYLGTAGPFVSYYMRGGYYLRTKSSLDRKAFSKRKCFEGSRKSAQRFALGNELASSVYAQVKEYRKVYPLYCFLKKRAIQLLKEGRTELEVETILTDYLQSFGLIREERTQKNMTHDQKGMTDDRWQMTVPQISKMPVLHTKEITPPNYSKILVLKRLQRIDDG